MEGLEGMLVAAGERIREMSTAEMDAETARAVAEVLLEQGWLPRELGLAGEALMAALVAVPPQPWREALAEARRRQGERFLEVLEGLRRRYRLPGVELDAGCGLRVEPQARAGALGEALRCWVLALEAVLRDPAGPPSRTLNRHFRRLPAGPLAPLSEAARLAEEIAAAYAEEFVLT